MTRRKVIYTTAFQMSILIELVIVLSTDTDNQLSINAGPQTHLHFCHFVVIWGKYIVLIYVCLCFDQHHTILIIVDV